MNSAASVGNRTLCFGGSFNPIHHAHLICARAVAEARGFEKVLLIPSRQPPHKRASADIADADQRLEMCRRAVAGSPLFEVSDLELRRTGPSYTIDTVRALKQQGWDKVHWLLGADMVQILPKWHDPQALMAETTFVLMARPGWTLDWQALPADYRGLERNVVEAPLLDIGATEIRRRLRAGKSIEYLVPESVRRYIEERGLYR